MNTPMNDNAFNRRKFLQSGGLALASAAILAAVEAMKVAAI